ncbi:MAG: glycosyltransferase family 2 protein [Bacteroidetes bacterium]|nr:glycosyltransferase family 2 protein [Bacteroidota bacterium]
MRPIAIPAYIKEKFYLEESAEKTCSDIRSVYPLLQKGDPEVSVVIPAYNEEKNILKTLSALANNRCKYNVEILVVNNNSKDCTEALVKDAGIRCILETVQGITAARNAGLYAAKGKYILNADADTIYPIDWIEEMVKPLAENQNVASVYGNFAFIPTAGTSRFVYFCYEYFADIMRWLNKMFKDEAVNVYGFNSGFKKEQGIAVEGFNHPPGTNEDGWLALKLREKKFGILYQVTNTKALVWTADRRIQMDGGLWKGILKRIKRVIGIKTEERTDL